MATAKVVGQTNTPHLVAVQECTTKDVDNMMATIASVQVFQNKKNRPSLLRSSRIHRQQHH